MTLLATATAPGKLLVSGEYAVLFGAEAVGLAVHPRASVEVHRSRSAAYSLEAPELLEGSRTFRLGDDGRIEWVGARPAALDLVRAVLELPAFRSGLSDLGPLRFVLDSRQFREQGRKLGLGSSAAITVALTGAIATALSLGFRLEDALAAHRDKHAGAGSGVDVALSALGGVRILASRRHSVTAEPAKWPKGLQSAALDTGVAASTSDMLECLDRWRRENGGAERQVRDLVAVANRTAGLWRIGAPDSVLEALSDYAVQLRGLDAAAGIGIFANGHDRLYSAASDFGIVYKPSGAGGGDLGLAFAEEPERLNGFVQHAVRLGFERRFFRGAASGVDCIGHTRDS